MSEDVSPKKKKRYSKEFKNDTKKRVRNGEKEDKVARDLGIPRSTLATWMQKDRKKSSIFELGKDRTDRFEKHFDLPVNKIVQQPAELDITYVSPISSSNNLDSVDQQQSTEEQIRNAASSKGNISGNNGNLQTTVVPDCPKMKSGRQMLYHDAEKQSENEYNIPIMTSNKMREITDPSSSTSLNLERKKYSIEQQQLAVVRVRTGAKIATVSKDMDIPESTISFWLRKINTPTLDVNEKINETISTSSDPCVNNDTRDGEKEDKVTKDINVSKFSTFVSKKGITDQFEERIDLDMVNEAQKSAEQERKKYSLEQQQLAVTLVTTGAKIATVSKDMGIPPSTISGWLKRNNLATSDENGKPKKIGNSTITKSMACTNDFEYKENGSKQSNTNAPSNESFELHCSLALNKTECSTSAAVLGNMNDITERKTASVFPQGDIQKNKEQKKSCDVKSGFSSGTDNIETGNKMSLTEKNAKYVDSSVEKRTGYTPKVKRDVLERVKGGKTIASVSKDLRIPASTICDWTRKEKMRENAQQYDCSPALKWKKWQEIMSSNNHGKGWAKREICYRLEKLSPHFEDRYGLFQLAVCKPTEKSVQQENIVYVKDGKILTLIERHCKYGFQKSSLINDKLQHDCSIKARCCYLTSQEEAAQEKTKLLQRYDYAWNKTRRDDVGNDSLSGDWSRWLLVMSPDDIGDDWINRDEPQFGYKRKNLEAWLKDECGIFEMAIHNPETEDDSVVFLACGKILTAIGRYCSDGSSAKSKQINDVLSKGYGILVRYCYAKSGTEEEARKLELQLLIRYDYKWHKQRTKRENIKDEQVLYKWTNWKLIMAPVKEDGFVERYGGNVGFRHGNIEALFEDRFGVFELQIARGDCKEVTYVQHGNILILLQRYCIDGYKRSAILNWALDEGYSIFVRHQYVNSDNGKENATTVLRQLLAIYDYAWNKTRREHIDDGDIAGDWSDWVTVMTPQIREGWTQRNPEDASKGYQRGNFTEFFEEKYGNFEMQVEYHPHFATSGIGRDVVHDKNGKMDTVVYTGKGNILTEARARCCNKMKQSVLIDQALKDGKSISVRYCYTENDTIEEAATLERQLLDRYDYPWIRSKREDVYDNDLPGEWSGWSKIMKPGEVEKGWEWRDEKYLGFKAKNLDGIFKDDYGVFELAIEKTYKNTVVHVGQGKVLSELKKYCKISTDGSYNSLQISDALAKRCSILVRYNEVQSQRSATDVEQLLVERYEYPWNPLNRTKREEVDDSCLPGQNWFEWQLLMAPKRNDPEWIRRDSGQTGYRVRLKDDIASDERGLYEWKIRKDRRTIVVYTGKAERLSHRLADYCKNGSHIEDNFNKALQYGYDVSVRMRIMRTSNIDDAENKLLDRYNYAWNKSRNGKERDIFLPYDMEHN